MRALVGPWILGTVVIVFGCIESNPDFDEPSAAGSTTDAGSSSASDASATPTTEAAATDDMTLETDTSSATSGTETADPTTAPTTETETTDPTTTTETTDPTTTTETTAAPCEPPCAPELEQCLDGVCACVDPGGDWQHCGGCGLVCRGQCVQGMCAKCPGNQVGCAGECVNTGNNDEHCGGCDIACLPGQNCIQGQCAG